MKFACTHPPKIFIALLIYIFSQHANAETAPILLNTHELPPYSFHNEKNQIDGIAVKVTECAFKKMQQPYRINFYPWIRAQKLVQLNLADAFFGASASEERNQYAVMSAIIAPQEWHWFLLNTSKFDPNHPTFKENATVGGFRGANMLEWLTNNNYNIEASPPTSSQLLKMLQAKRIDAILANKLVMDQLLAEHGLQDRIHSVLQQNKPLGIYVSKTYLAKQSPNFMSRLNTAIQLCTKNQSPHSNKAR